MKIAVTGFDPFGEGEINPTFEAIKKLPAEITGAETVKVEVPTVFGTNDERVAETIEIRQPDMVVCIGQTSGRQTVTVEKVAINLAGAHIPDNAGQQPNDVSLVEDGVTTYFTNLPIKVMVRNCHDHQPPAAISYTVGAFVCNGITYHLLHLINTKCPTIRGGFIHVLFLPEQTVDKPTLASMSLEAITGSLFCMVEAVIKIQEDIQLQGDTTR